MENDDKKLSVKWDERFRLAYEAEFGVSFDRVIDAFAELIDLAGEYGRVVVTTRGANAERLRAKRGFSVPEVEAFLARRPSMLLRHRRASTISWNS